LNSTIQSVAPDILALGWQVLHIVGGKNPVPQDRPPGYVALAYCDEMDKALAAATLMISRAGAATVSEIQLLGIPAIFVPYPVGNGEQEKNAEDSLRASAAVLVLDREFTPEYVRSMVIPMLADDAAIRRMADNAVGLGRPDAARAFVAVMMEALRDAGNSRGKK
jgi:UDP-N-acetylglucosamine--N-acetylmuramyl-(pentapeptide) pyrophosphoryl-undecaprenol N-acetylglucosamine transferase